MTESDWNELGKLIELVRTHRVKLLETTVGALRVKIYSSGRTTHLELREVVHA